MPLGEFRELRRRHRQLPCNARPITGSSDDSRNCSKSSHSGWPGSKRRRARSSHALQLSARSTRGSSARSPACFSSSSSFHFQTTFARSVSSESNRPRRAVSDRSIAGSFRWWPDEARASGHCATTVSAGQQPFRPVFPGWSAVLRSVKRRHATVRKSSYKLTTCMMTGWSDQIRHVRLSSVVLPLDQPISDAKVLTGRQQPMTEIVFLFAEIATAQDQHGIGFSYSKRAGGPAQYAHAKEVAAELIGEDPSDIGEGVRQAALGRRVGRPVRGGDAGDRGDRHRAVGPEGEAGAAAAGQAARRASRLGARVQHLRRVPARADRGGQGARVEVAGGRDRRDQDQGRPAGHAGSTWTGSAPSASTSATAYR